MIITVVLIAVEAIDALIIAAVLIGIVIILILFDATLLVVLKLLVQ
jgi:hypothetical protein